MVVGLFEWVVLSLDGVYRGWFIFGVGLCVVFEIGIWVVGVVDVNIFCVGNVWIFVRFVYNCYYGDI